MSGRADPDRRGVLRRTADAVIARALQRRLVRAMLRFSARRGPVLADAVTYRALFSVFAGVLLAFSVAALWLTGDDAAWDAAVHAVDAAVPGLIATAGAPGIVDPDGIRAPAGLSLAGAVALVSLIGAALGAIGSLRVAIRSIAGTTQGDSAWYRVTARNALLALIIALTFTGAAALTLAGERVVDALAALLGLPAASVPVRWAVRIVSLIIALALNATLIAALFRLLSGMRVALRSLWGGALLGGFALLVLQELSGLLVGGAKTNPLLASFASLLALLLWLNLSTQVILLACAFIVESALLEHDRVVWRFGAQSLADAAARLAEEDVRTATQALQAARAAVRRADG